MKLTHTDLKPENILFLNSEYDVSYSNTKKVKLNFRLSLTDPALRMQYIHKYASVYD